MRAPRVAEDKGGPTSKCCRRVSNTFYINLFNGLFFNVEEKQGQDPNLTITIQRATSPNCPSGTLQRARLLLSQMEVSAYSRLKKKPARQPSLLMKLSAEGKIKLFLIKQNGTSKCYFSWEVSCFCGSPALCQAAQRGSTLRRGAGRNAPIPSARYPQPLAKEGLEKRHSERGCLSGICPMHILPAEPSTCWSSPHHREKLHNIPFSFFFFIPSITRHLESKTILHKFSTWSLSLSLWSSPLLCGTLPRGTHNLCCDSSIYLGYNGMLPPHFLSSHKSMK